MQEDKEVRVSYGLREASGERRLLNIESQSNRGSDCCGENRYSLTFDEGYPRYRVKNPRTAARVLVEDTPWFNTDDRRPGWGGVKVSDLEVVKIVETLAIERVDIERPFRIPETINTYDKTKKLAERYIDRELPELDSRYAMRLMVYPEGETFDSIREKCVDKTVVVGKTSGVEAFCWGVFETPEEYVELFKGKPGFCMITSDTWHIRKDEPSDD